MRSPLTLLLRWLMGSGLWVIGFSAGVVEVEKQPRNLFAELLCKSDAEITGKLDAAWRQILAPAEAH